EIAPPQLRQRARRRSQESTGTLSYQRMAAPHRGQAEAGCTMLTRAGSLAITTLRKLPMTRPTRRDIPSKNQSGTADRSYTGYARHIVGRRPRTCRRGRGDDPPPSSVLMETETMLPTAG